MGRRAARFFGEPERPAWSGMILALATNVRHSATIDRYAGRKFERASDRNWPPSYSSSAAHRSLGSWPLQILFDDCAAFHHERHGLQTPDIRQRIPSYGY